MCATDEESVRVPIITYLSSACRLELVRDREKEEIKCEGIGLGGTVTSGCEPVIFSYITAMYVRRIRSPQGVF